MELRGCFCSDACKADHLASKPIGNARGRSQAREREDRQEKQADLIATWLLRRIPLIILALILIGLGLFFLDRSGKERWKLVPAESTPFVDLAPAGNAVIAMRSDGTCVSLDGASGKENWTSQPGSRTPSGTDMEMGFSSLFGTSLEFKEGLVVKRGFSSLSVLLAGTGKTLWQRDVGWFERSPVAISKGRALFINYSAPTNGATDEIRAENPFAALAFGLGGSPSPSLVCEDVNSGRELWHRTLEGREVRSVNAAGDICFCISCLSPRLDWVPCSEHSATNPAAMFDCKNCKRHFVKASSYEMNVMRANDGTPLWTGRMTSGFIDQIRLFDDRIAVLAGSHLYVLSLDGGKKAHSRLPPDTHKVCIGGDCAAAATRSGRIVVLSTRDGRTMWEQTVGGQAWDLDIAANSLYVTAGVPKETKDRTSDGTPKSPVPLAPHEQLLKEMKSQYGAYGDEDDLRSKPECRTLINYRLTDGRERWRRNAVVGELHVLPDGNCLLLAQGAEAAALFISAGSGSYVSEHLQRNGKEAWHYKVQEATSALRADADTVYLLTGEGRGIFGTWSSSETRNGTIHAVRRRTFINRVRKF